MAALKFMTDYPAEYYQWAKKTYFLERILIGVYGGANKVPLKYRENPELEIKYLGPIRPKIHTLRKPQATIKKGTPIKFVTDLGVEFCKPVKCMAVQKVNITWAHDNAMARCTVKVGNKVLGELRLYAGVLVHLDDAVKLFLYNDGFDNPVLFAKWFTEGGKFDLIHWTDKKY